MGKKPNPQTCERCPNRYRKEGCPSWIRKDLGIQEKNDLGQRRLMEGCFYEIMPKLVAYLFSELVRNNAAVQSHRNVIAEGFSSVLRLHDENHLPKRVEVEDSLVVNGTTLIEQVHEQK